MPKHFFAVMTILLLLGVVLIQFAAVPLSAQDAPTPTLPIPFATLSLDPVTAALASDYPRVDGSTSTFPLQRIIACKILGVPCAMKRSGPEMVVWPVDDNTGPGEPGEPIANILHSGTHDAYVNLIAGETDLILVAREPSLDELDAAEEAGVVLDVQPFAWDAFVFLVNAENPRRDFTLDEIRAIYSGQITTWTELGVEKWLSDDPANPIQPYIRDPNSGSQELMENLVMQGTPVIDLPDMLVGTMMGLVNAIIWDEAGIGYSVYYYATFMAPDPAVKLAAIEGVLPTSKTIAEGSYPLITDVYVVVRAGTPPGSPAMYLRDWLLTEEGKAVVGESGYVPVINPCCTHSPYS
jgi:phosphate transport system substrate-binding protein